MTIYDTSFNNQFCIYQEKGFKNRREYLIDVALEYGADQKRVFLLASTLGANEDFDGLLTMVEDLLCY